MEQVEAELVKKGFQPVSGVGIEGLCSKQYRRWPMGEAQDFMSAGKVCLVWCEDVAGSST